MKKHYFLGLNARRRHAWRHLFTIGRKSDFWALSSALESKYGGTAVLCKNGRSGLAMALKAYFKPGDGIIINGFTCYAVVEAVKAAGCVPIYADINRETLNFDINTLESASYDSRVRGVIIQNTLGIPVDIEAVEKFAKKHTLVMIEDLAHLVGVKYPDGREVGTVGAATALSFGKDKAIDTISGGAVILRDENGISIKPYSLPTTPPRLSDATRARFYPLFTGAVRGLARVHLGGVLMRLLLKLHWVEKSADNALDLSCTLTKAEAHEALSQLPHAKGVDREFYLVRDRGECLRELKRAGYHFDGFWYEKPVSPERYYKKVHFPEENCKEAVFVAEHIVNFPTYYTKSELDGARTIVKKYLLEEGERE